MKSEQIDNHDSKKLTPMELEMIYSCQPTSEKPVCPIFDFCFHGEGSNCTTCQGTWAKYLKMQEQGKL